MNLYDLDTPALILDLDRLESNIQRMAAVAAGGGKALRPHTKTHKTPEIARMQLAAGAQGITVAKLGEAEVMADAGITDIFVANQIVGSIKVARLIALSRKANIIIGVDNMEAVSAMASEAASAGLAIPIRMEIDTGIRRAGLRTVESAVAFGLEVSKLPGVKLDGIFTYEGHANNGGPSDRETACHQASQMLREVAEALRAKGVAVNSVSVGSTAGAPIMAKEQGITELRAGVYVFNDRGQVARGAREEDCALTVLATVTSRPEETVAIVDAGTKSLSGDKGVEGSKHGQIADAPDVIFDWANEEHGHLDLSGSSFRPKLGEKVRIVPFHACTATNMHDTIYGVRGEQVEVTWRIAGRGKIQ